MTGYFIEVGEEKRIFVEDLLFKSRRRLDGAGRGRGHLLCWWGD